jgi:hypothetical protein
MTRVSDLKRFGTYASQAGYVSGLKHELVISKKYLEAGYRIAAIPFHCVHTGGGRSRACETLPNPPRILIAVPVCHKFEYSRWESGDSPHYEQSKAWQNKPYGTDIHISGNGNLDRISALRDTWLKDIEPFKSHVDYKLFFGTPHPRPAEADEVFLLVPDDYAALPLKTREICKYALEHNYDYVVKCDDDSFVFVDKLIREITFNKFDYAGWCNGNVCSGGPGYILSKRAFTLVANNFSNTSWAEDVCTGHVLTNAKITPVHLEAHRPGFAAHWFFPKGFDPSVDLSSLVALHAMQPEVMRELYAAITNSRT